MTVESTEATTTKAFLTDTSLCIGCKACEVACKQWNQLPMDGLSWLGTSYDNTHHLSAATWRHVTFLEKPGAGGPGGQNDWLMMSDVCKHCEHAGCLEACPTGAIFRSEFGTVVIQQDICNGCGYCVPSCPFGVVDLDLAGVAGAPEARDGKAHKCTMCYDRMEDGLEPACAKACPTDSIIFGDLDDLQQRAEDRVAELRGKGLNAYHYGNEEVGGTNGIGTLHASFILLDSPNRYNLPEQPILPQRHVLPGFLTMTAAAVGFVAATIWALSGDEQ